jgi:hypothetical protein
VLAGTSFLHPLASLYVRIAASTSGHVTAPGTPANAGSAVRSVSVGVMTSALTRLMPRDALVRVPCSIICEATHTTFPSPGHRLAASFTSAYRHWSIIGFPDLPLTAFIPPAQIPAGSVPPPGRPVAFFFRSVGRCPRGTVLSWLLAACFVASLAGFRTHLVTLWRGDQASQYCPSSLAW